MFRVRVLATQKEMAVIAQAARRQGQRAPQFVTRVVKRLARSLKAKKISPARPAPLSTKNKSLRRRPKS